MTSTIILVVICVALIILLVPVKSAMRWSNEGFLTGEIENPPPHLVMGSQSEMEESHATDVYSRLATVRIDPY